MSGKHVKKTDTGKKKIILISVIAAAVIIAITAGIILTKTLSGIGVKSEGKGLSIVKTVRDQEYEPQSGKKLDKDGETETNQEPEDYNGPINPLTGLAVREDISGNRPYAVMLNNLKVATPQEGIGKADIIYETLAEGGITRFMVVLQDLTAADVLGSVRSARPYFVDLALGHDAIYIHAGGSDDAYGRIKSSGIAHIDGVNGSGETFYRDKWREKNMGLEHSLMLDTSLVEDYVSKNKFRTTHDEDYSCNMVFTDEKMSSGETGENIVVTFSSGKNTAMYYDAETGLYTLNQYGSTMTDSSDGSAVSVRNIVIIKTSVKTVDSAGRLSITLTGSGEGYFVRDGKYVPITWSRDSASSQFVYTMEDGSEVSFGRGKTYIGIISKSSGKVNFS